MHFRIKLQSYRVITGLIPHPEELARAKGLEGSRPRNQHRDHMVRGGAFAPPHHGGLSAAV